MKKYIYIVLLALAPLFGARASNIQVANVKIVGRDITPGTAFVQFDVSWDYSWKDRTHYNWDAAWVFIKSYDETRKEWRHVYLVDPTGAPVNNGSGCYMKLPHKIGAANEQIWSDFGKSMTDYGEKYTGVFLYRRLVGHGSMLIEKVQLLWDYAEDGYSTETNLQVSVFAIEMVYCPAHDYIIGDGYSKNSLQLVGNNLVINDAVGAVHGRNHDNLGQVLGETGYTFNGTPIPDEYPKGHKGFYIMKYEISQHAYADFLNTLTAVQQEGRASASPYAVRGTLAMIPAKYNSNPTQYRNYIRIRNAGVRGNGDNAPVAAKYGHSVTGGNNDGDWEMETNGGNIACNFLSWEDGLAYLDWSALRPMSELEFEKACRGTKFLRGEMAWGEKYGTPITTVGGAWFTDPYKPNEKAAKEEANYIPTGKAPWVMRVGAFSGDSTWRNEAGATYYGVLNMSDNLWERAVNVSTPQGRSFIGQEGDGVLDQMGDAEVYPNVFTNTPCWPTDEGGGFRGNAVSDRTYAQSKQVINNEGLRTPYTGFRGCRYVPDGGDVFELW